MQSKLRTHCMLKEIGQLKIAVNNQVRHDAWHTLVTYTVSEIEKPILAAKLKEIKLLNIDL